MRRVVLGLAVLALALCGAWLSKRESNRPGPADRRRARAARALVAELGAARARPRDGADIGDAQLFFDESRDTPLRIGTVGAEIAAQGRTSVELDVSPVEQVERVALAGVLVMPVEWDLGN